MQKIPINIISAKANARQIIKLSPLAKLESCFNVKQYLWSSKWGSQNSLNSTWDSILPTEVYVMPSFHQTFLQKSRIVISICFTAYVSTNLSPTQWGLTSRVTMLTKFIYNNRYIPNWNVLFQNKFSATRQVNASLRVCAFQIRWSWSRPNACCRRDVVLTGWSTGWRR